MCPQVKGQKKVQKSQQGKAKVDKQEVEIRRRMTVAALAQAMNKDFGKRRSVRPETENLKEQTNVSVKPSLSTKASFTSLDMASFPMFVALNQCVNQLCVLRSIRSRVGSSPQHAGGSGLFGTRLCSGGAVDQRGRDPIRDEVQMGPTERDQREREQRRPQEVRFHLKVPLLHWSALKQHRVAFGAL